MTYDNYRETKFSVPRFDGVNAPQSANLRCVCVYIPDTDDAAALLAKLIALPTLKTNWEGTENDRIYQAMAWLNGYLMTEFSGCFDCQKVADCLSDPDSPAYDVLHSAINSALKDTAQGSTNYGASGTASSGDTELAFGENPTCDPDILWSQCLGLVQFIDRSITDTLEIIETYSNPSEVAAFLGDSLLGKVLSLGATEAVDFVASMTDYMLETIAEGYQAEYTPAIEVELACLLFCAAKDDCSITIDRLYSVMAERAEQAVIETSLADLITAITGVPIGSSTVVPVAYWAWAGLLRVASLFWTGGASFGLESAIAYSSETPSNDWQLFCDDCTVPAGIYYDFLTGDQGFTISVPPSRGVYGGTGVGFETTNNVSGGTSVFFERIMTAGATVTKVKIEYECTVAPQANPLSRVIRASVPQLTVKNTQFPVGISVAETGAISIAVLANQKFGFDLNLDDAPPYTSGTGRIRRVWVYFSVVPSTADWGGELFYE